MGLNGLLANIFMKYYLENFTPIISSKIKCIVTTRKKILYLSKNGLYEIKNNSKIKIA